MPTEGSYLSGKAWDERLRRELKAVPFPRPFESRRNITLTEARAVGSYPDTVIEVIFTDEGRPDCTFGWKWGTGGWLEAMPEYAADDPEWVVSMMWANLAEATSTSRLSSCECSGDEVTWLN